MINTANKLSSPVLAEKQQRAKGKTKALVFASDEDYAPYLAVLLNSIAENARQPQNYDIIVMNCCKDGDSAAFKNILADIEAYFSVRNKNASGPHFVLRCINMREILEKNRFIRDNERAFARFGYATYARLFIPQLLSDYERALYFDIDQLVLADIADLVNFPLGENLIAAVPDISAAIARLNNNNERKREIEQNLGLIEQDYYIIAAPLLFNIPACRNFSFTQKNLDFLASHADLEYPDQDAINAVCRGKIAYLPQFWGRVNASSYGRSLSRIKKAPGAASAVFTEQTEPRIIHYTTMPKPWNAANTDFACIWWRYAMKTKGGTELLLAPHSPFSLPGSDENFSKTYKLLGFPVWTVKAQRQERRYYLGGIPVMRKKRGKENVYIYILGVKLISFPAN